MIKYLTVVAALFLLVGCVSPTRALEEGRAGSPGPEVERQEVAGFMAADYEAVPGSYTLSTLEPSPRVALSSAPATAEESGGDSGDERPDNYFNLKAGPFFPSESDQDLGYLISGAYGKYFSRLFSFELEGGYYEPDHDSSAIDILAVPLFVNARINLPLWILEAYGGVGLGTIYHDVETPVGDEDGWLFAGNAFLGANLVLFDTLTAGLEAKYIVTEEVDDLDETLDGLVAALTLGFRF